MFSLLCHHQRVGSTFLQNCVDSHTKLAGIDECFVNVAKRSDIRKSGFVPYVRCDVNTPKEYIEDVVIKTHQDKKGICMKLAYQQILHHDGLLTYIKENKIPIIHLMRKNLVKQVVSYLTMDKIDHKHISITPDHMFHMVKQAKEENEYWSNILKNQIKLTLYYEDIIGKTVDDKTYLDSMANIAVCNFFKVKQQQLFATTKKKNKNDISVYLPNIENIKKRLKGTEFYWMVEG